MRNFMAQNGYADIHPLYVYKPQQNMTGMGWICAVEQMIVGYKGDMQHCAVTSGRITLCSGTTSSLDFKWAASSGTSARKRR